MAVATPRLLALLFAVSLFLSQTNAAGPQDRPKIIIYTGTTSPGYGVRLGEIIEEDGRIDADIQIVESPDVFRLMLFFPTVKLAIISSSAEKNENLGEALEWFYQSGGGLIALGLASSDYSVGNASETVFPIFGTSYKTGAMDRVTRKFMMTHLKDQEDEISDGIGDFTVVDHKILISFNKTTNSYVPRFPDSGDFKILYRENQTGAPSIVKYEKEGVSVTFASFGGDDFEKGFAYYGSYADTVEFRTLFTNAAYWVWTNERKFDVHNGQALSYYEDQQQDLIRVREEVEDAKSRTSSNRNLRLILTLLLAALGCIGVYWATLRIPENG